MLVIVAILLFFGFVVRHKWRNAAAKKEEILRLVSTVSEEEAEIEKQQAVDEYNSPPPPPPPPTSQLERRYYCAVCCCPSSTRCSQCKAVRYCSAKCQIIHWRQGHKDDCRPATSMHAGKENKCVVETARDDKVEKHSSDEAKICSDTAQVDDSGSSSCSLHCFSSSTQQSEASLDASGVENLGSGTPIRPPKVVSDFHSLQTTADSDETNVPGLLPMNFTVNALNNTIEVNKIGSTLAARPDEGFQPKNFRDKTTDDGAGKLEEFVRGATESRSCKSSSSSKGSSTADNHISQAQPSSDKVMKSMYFNRSGYHNQVYNFERRNSQYSKFLSMSSNEFWRNEAQRCNGKETRSMSIKSSGNDRKTCAKNVRPCTLLSEIESVRMVSQPSSKGLTSVRKFVKCFRVSKQSKSYALDTGKDTAGNYNHKIIFPPKIFMQLYSYHDLEPHPFGLMNCGNSCYANAVLQCLTFTRPVTSYLLQGLHSKTCHKEDWCLICEFERLIWKGQETNSPLSPDGILSQIRRLGSHLSHGREEDAHDFLRNVVDAMQHIWLEEAGVSGFLGEDSTLLGLTFGGYLQSKIKCMKCSGRSEQCDRMMDLTVGIDGAIDTLEEALAQFTISETLGGDDKYRCSRCKSYEKAKKTLTVIEAPNILTIVLKRFRPGSLEKLNKLVQFPEILNLAPYMSGMCDKYPIYHLYAVVVHLNLTNAADSGHYISYVKDFRGDWFRIDDSRVSHVDRETVLSVEAYILFYARHAPRVPCFTLDSSLVHFDGKTTRNMEAISASTSAKKKNSKSKPTSSDCRHLESSTPQQRSGRSSHVVPSNDFPGNSEEWGFHSMLKNPLVDWSSDSSSIFSASDAGSCSTDSTKDSNAEDISGCILGFGSYRSK